MNRVASFNVMSFSDDRTRVILPKENGCGDYINASYIQVGDESLLNFGTACAVYLLVKNL